jgi:hypothetical protein
VTHTGSAVDKTRLIELKTDPNSKGLRWALHKDLSHLNASAQADLDALVEKFAAKRTARAWLYR